MTTLPRRERNRPRVGHSPRFSISQVAVDLRATDAMRRRFLELIRPPEVDSYHKTKLCLIIGFF